MPTDLYDEMSDLDDMGDEAAAEGDMGEAEDIDAEFAMHASEAGFDTPEKQKALKAAIERCNALKDEGEYEEPADDAGAGDDEDPLEAFA